MKYTIKTPNAAFTGIRLGLAIQDGTGHTDDVDVAREAKGLGYAVEPDPAVDADAEDKPKAKADKPKTDPPLK
jgi:hypothetical protein